MATTDYGSDLTLNKLEGKNWVAALMLCWTFGYLGAHRFYTGKNGTAWAMVGMSITGCLSIVSFIWAFVDGVMIALGKFTHDDGSELYERINWLGYVYIAVMVLTILFVLLYSSVVLAAVGTVLTSGGHPPIAP